MRSAGRADVSFADALRADLSPSPHRTLRRTSPTSTCRLSLGAAPRRQHRRSPYDRHDRSARRGRPDRRMPRRRPAGHARGGHCGLRPRYFKMKLSGRIGGRPRPALPHRRACSTARPATIASPSTATSNLTTPTASPRWSTPFSPTPALARLRAAILFIEQPIHAHDCPATRARRAGDAMPIIIDESDDEHRRALDAAGAWL